MHSTIINIICGGVNEDDNENDKVENDEKSYRQVGPLSWIYSYYAFENDNEDEDVNRGNNDNVDNENDQIENDEETGKSYLQVGPLAWICIGWAAHAKCQTRFCFFGVFLLLFPACFFVLLKQCLQILLTL